LERDRSERERRGAYVVWGLHLAQEALAASAPLERAFVSAAADRSAEGRSAVARLRRSAPVATTSDRVLESIAAGAGDQGFVLVVRRPAGDLASLLSGRPTLLVLAHGVQDPGNLGSTIRTALALGADALVALEGCADPYASRAARAAMGALFRLPVLAAGTERVLPALRAAGLALVAADVGGRERPDAIDLRPPIALALGSEARGLPPAILAEAAARARIPMARGCASLNVHAAAAALLYETMRQRGFPGAL
jgi:TrmH family RNA methyltransferase